MNGRTNVRAVVAIVLVALGLIAAGLPAQAKPAKSPPPTAPATPPEIPVLPQPAAAQPAPPLPSGSIPAPVQAGDEILGLRTERSKTFAAEAVGEYTTELYSERVHFQDAATGAYQEIDAELAPSKDGLRQSKANSFVLELADDADAATVAKLRLDDDHSVGFALEGATDSKATTEKDASTYAGATDGVELRLTSRPDGLKEELVLASAAAGDQFVFPLELNGLSASLNDNGDVVYLDEAGVERARTPHGFMTDSAVDPNSGDSPKSTGVAYALVPHGKGTALEVTLTDKTWLHDPARTWPVVVDPQIAVATFADDTFVTSGFHFDNSHDLELRAGTYDGGAHVTRSFMKFDTSAINGKTVNWAQLHVAERHSWNCSSGWPTVHRVTGGWDGTTMQDWPGAAFDANQAGGLISADGPCYGRTVVYDVTSAAAYWAANPTQSYGLALNASATDNNAYKKFASSETGAPPALHVNWTDPPPPPSGNAFGYVDGVSPIVGGVAISGWAMDPDAATSPIDVHVYRDANIFVEALRANTSRPDVGAAYPGYGNNHGFVGYAPMAAGSHQVCAYAVNVGAGSAVTAIGCRTVVVPGRTINEPLGNLESITPSPGGATSKGWAFDPDTVAASTVQVYADLAYAGTLTANTSRPDVGAAYPGYGNNHGYEGFLAMAPGFHNVCVFAINTLAGSAHPLLGCRQVTIAPHNPPSAPTNVVATTNPDRSVTVTWTPSASSGGSPIDFYAIYAYDSATGYVGIYKVVYTASCGQSCATTNFPGLAPSSYFFVAYAHNGVYPTDRFSSPTISNTVVVPPAPPDPTTTTSSTSTTSTSTSSTTSTSTTTTTTPPSGPDAPTKPLAEAQALQATVTWTAPADHGSQITSYVVRAEPGTAIAIVEGSGAIRRPPRYRCSA